jgi:fumarate reductase subunit C
MRHDRIHKSVAAYLCSYISHMPARLDLIQSTTGFILAFFIVAHLLFEASILISKEAMYSVTKMFEGYYFFGEAYPGMISFLAAAIFFIFILHALTAMRKFPSSYRQYRIYMSHIVRFQHNDSSLWFVQVVTGFMLFFLGSVHLYIMMTMPSKIGPYASADRIYSDWMWPLYLLLLICVILHAFIGLYRLFLKWGLFEKQFPGNKADRNPKQARQRLKKVMTIGIVVYMLIGLSSLATYMIIGYQHADQAGERFQIENKKVQP